MIPCYCSKSSYIYCLYFLLKKPFIDVEDVFMVELQDPVVLKNLENYLRHVETETLLSLLTEYIVSELPDRTENDADFPYVSLLMLLFIFLQGGCKLAWVGGDMGSFAILEMLGPMNKLNQSYNNF